MAKTVTAITTILKAEERLLERLLSTLPLMAHKESKALVREAIKAKKGSIRSYKTILKNAAKCPAVKNAAPKMSGCGAKTLGRPGR